MLSKDCPILTLWPRGVEHFTKAEGRRQQPPWPLTGQCWSMAAGSRAHSNPPPPHTHIHLALSFINRSHASLFFLTLLLTLFLTLRPSSALFLASLFFLDCLTPSQCHEEAFSNTPPSHACCPFSSTPYTFSICLVHSLD